MSEKSGLVAYEIRVKDDGLHVTLSQAHREFVKYLGQNGGEVMMDWDDAESQRKSDPATRRETIKEHLLKLKDMKLLSERILIGGNRSLVRLTDIGRNVLTQILAGETANA